MQAFPALLAWPAPAAEPLVHHFMARGAVPDPAAEAALAGRAGARAALQKRALADEEARVAREKRAADLAQVG